MSAVAAVVRFASVLAADPEVEKCKVVGTTMAETAPMIAMTTTISTWLTPPSLCSRRMLPSFDLAQMSRR